MLVRVLTILPRTVSRRFLSALTERGVSCTAAHTRQNLKALLHSDSFDLVLLEPRPDDGATRAIVEEVRGLAEPPEVVLVAQHEDAAERERLLAAGAWAVVSRELPPNALRETLRGLVERRRTEIHHRLRGLVSPPRLEDFASESPVMQHFLDTARRVVDADSSLLILGETGVGKEHLARTIHAESRRPGHFVAVNCAALPEQLIESELFGHEAGAFTGALRARRGFFELADRGTIFLDEVGDLPPHIQVKLLRVLQEKTIVPVGAERVQEVDVRIMAATHCDLAADMAAGRFRSDLYYRLAVITLAVPPLRERREDIAVLVRHYVRHYQLRLKRLAVEIQDDALRLLVEHRWPGNVRELINVIERAVLLCSGERITPLDLPEDIRGAPLPVRRAAPVPRAGIREGLTYHTARHQLLACWEREYFPELLRQAQGRIGRAAGLAGVSPRFLHGKLKELGLRREKFRPPAADSHGAASGSTS